MSRGKKSASDVSRCFDLHAMKIVNVLRDDANAQLGVEQLERAIKVEQKFSFQCKTAASAAWCDFLAHLHQSSVRESRRCRLECL